MKRTLRWGQWMIVASAMLLLFWVAAIGVAFLLLLGFIAVTVTANSIRSAILSRGDEIGIMQLVGAPLWMVRGPFVIEGAVTGAVAGGLAGVLALVACVIAVQAGAEIEEGALVCVIEAMKMENEITAHKAGKVAELPIAVGASIATGDTIAVIT